MTSSSAAPGPAPSFRRTPLTTSAGTTWQVRAAVPPAGEIGAELGHQLAEGIPATVPGEVHADLLAADLIPDPFDGDNEGALHWVGRTDWTWRAEFDWAGGDEARHDLVVAGLDTVAVLVLNGTEIGRTANQHRTHRVDLSATLRTGRNTLEITVEAPVTAAERLSEALGPRPRAYGHPFNAIRKMASAYGWDWGPDLAGAGLLGSIGIESWSVVRLAAVAPNARLDGGIGVLQARIELEWAEDASGSTTVTVQCQGEQATSVVQAGSTVTTLGLEVSDARPWWPRGYGDQPLSELTVALDDGDPGWTGRVGFRTVGLSTAPDAVGSEYVLSVNGRDIFVKGANWIPDDALMSRLTPATYRASITDAADAGLNLLRVWGGGIYESEDFYAVCDELGILVWQDFLFACAAYSEEEPLAGEVEAEAREAITRLSTHPSLVIWNGNNENIWGFVDWGWRAQLQGATWGDGYYTELLPRLVETIAPGTPYTAGSPFSFAPYHYPNDPRHGTMHIWDVWNARDYAVYRNYQPRFVSEFGFQGPAAWSTLTSVVHDQPLDPHGHQMLVHQKANEGNAKLERGLGDHLPLWGSDGGVVAMDDWHWTTQLNQARAVGFGISHFRSLFPHCRGSVVWQLNDNWPVISWAAVDAHGIRKPLWYALRAVHADRFVTVQPRPAGTGNGRAYRHKSYVDLSGGPSDDHEVPTVVLHNDTDTEWAATLSISRRGTGPGSPVLATQETTVTVAARTAVDVALEAPVATAADPHGEIVTVVTDDAAPAFWYFVEDTSLSLLDPARAYEVETEVTERGTQVRVTAHALAKDLALFPDRLDPAARVDSALITLLAGEQHTFTVTGAEHLDPEALATKPVLRSVNDLVT